MLLEIKKEQNKYVVKNPPSNAGTHFFIEVDAKHIILKKSMKPIHESKAYKAIKELTLKYPEDEFLKISLELTPKDYHYGHDRSDEDLLNDALKDKYGL